MEQSGFNCPSLLAALAVVVLAMPSCVNLETLGGKTSPDAHLQFMATPIEGVGKAAAAATVVPAITVRGLLSMGAPVGG